MLEQSWRQQMLFASVTVSTFLLGFSALFLAERTPEHVARLETAAGALFVSGFLLCGAALPGAVS
jgi:hypothetical protein